jgi:recombination protein RecR
MYCRRTKRYDGNRRNRCFFRSLSYSFRNNNPLENRTPEKLRIKELINRLQENNFEEILIATNPTIEGDATFLYLQNLIKTTFPNIKISKIATGLPMGGVLEYADKHTLSRAIEQKQYF